MRNVCGSMPGLLDRGTLGHPGKLSYVIAENEAESPWTPLHVERGLPARAEHGHGDGRRGAAPVLQPALAARPRACSPRCADDMRISGSVMGQPELRASSSPASTCGRSPATAGARSDIRQFLFEHTQNSHAHLKRTQRMAGRDPARRRDDACGPLVASPDDILVVAAGGRAGAFSCYIPGWGSARQLTRPSPRRSSDDRAPRSHRRGGRADRSPTRPGRTRWPASASASIENTKFNSDRLLVKIGEHPQGGVRRRRDADVPQAQRQRARPRGDHRRRSRSLRRHGRRRRRLRVLLVGQCARRNPAGEARRALGLHRHRRVRGDRPRHGRAVGPAPLQVPDDAAPDREPHRGAARPARAGDRARRS